MLRTVPVAASLRRAFPQAHIDWVVQTGFEDAVRGHPAVDGVVPFARRALGRWWRSPAQAAAAVRFFHGLGKGRYDLAIDCQGLGRSGLMLGATRAGRRIGFANAREFGFLGANERHVVPRDLHAVDRMLALLEAAGIEPTADMGLVVPDDCEGSWASLRAATGIPESFVAFAPTSRWRSKAWPEERWCLLAQHLLAKGVGHIVLLGAGYERPALDAMAALAPDSITVLAGEAPVGVSMAAVRDARLLVANDSAMLHAAVGLATPLIGLFGPTDPVVSGPYGQGAQTIRSPEAQASGVHYRLRGLGDEWMRRISVEAVLERAMGALQ